MANWVRQARDGLGLNQSEFALKVGVSYAAVQKWEQGKSKPRLKWRRRIEALQREAAPEGRFSVPADLRPRINLMATNKSIDIATALRQIIEAGLAQFAPSAEAGIGPSIDPHESTAELRRQQLTLKERESALKESQHGKSRKPSHRKRTA